MLRHFSEKDFLVSLLAKSDPFGDSEFSARGRELRFGIVFIFFSVRFDQLFLLPFGDFLGVLSHFVRRFFRFEIVGLRFVFGGKSFGVSFGSL